jgi:hypothetical protein
MIDILKKLILMLHLDLFENCYACENFEEIDSCASLKPFWELL